MAAATTAEKVKALIRRRSSAKLSPEDAAELDAGMQILKAAAVAQARAALALRRSSSASASAAAAEGAGFEEEEDEDSDEESGQAARGAAPAKPAQAMSRWARARVLLPLTRLGGSRDHSELAPRPAAAQASAAAGAGGPGAASIVIPGPAAATPATQAFSLEAQPVAARAPAFAQRWEAQEPPPAEPPRSAIAPRPPPGSGILKGSAPMPLKTAAPIGILKASASAPPNGILKTPAVAPTPARPLAFSAPGERRPSQAAAPALPSASSAWGPVVTAAAPVVTAPRPQVAASRNTPVQLPIGRAPPAPTPAPLPSAPLQLPSAPLVATPLLQLAPTATAPLSTIAIMMPAPQPAPTAAAPLLEGLTMAFPTAPLAAAPAAFVAEPKATPPEPRSIERRSAAATAAVASSAVSSESEAPEALPAASAPIAMIRAAFVAAPAAAVDRADDAPSSLGSLAQWHQAPPLKGLFSPASRPASPMGPVPGPSPTSAPTMTPASPAAPAPALSPSVPAQTTADSPAPRPSLEGSPAAAGSAPPESTAALLPLLAHVITRRITNQAADCRIPPPLVIAALAAVPAAAPSSPPCGALAWYSSAASASPGAAAARRSMSMAGLGSPASPLDFARRSAAASPLLARSSSSPVVCPGSVGLRVAQLGRSPLGTRGTPAANLCGMGPDGIPSTNSAPAPRRTLPTCSNSSPVPACPQPLHAKNALVYSAEDLFSVPDVGQRHVTRRVPSFGDGAAVAAAAAARPGSSGSGVSPSASSGGHGVNAIPRWAGCSPSDSYSSLCYLDSFDAEDADGHLVTPSAVAFFAPKLAEGARPGEINVRVRQRRRWSAVGM